MWAEARAPTLLAIAPSALVRADARAPTLLACAPYALMRADARAPALLASAPLALMRALRALLLWRSAALLVVFDPIAFIAARLFLLGDTAAWLRHQFPLTALLPLGRPATLLRLDCRCSLMPRCTFHFQADLVHGEFFFSQRERTRRRIHSKITKILIYHKDRRSPWRRIC